MRQLKGIDVSASNGKIDWKKVKESIDFAIIRIGFGSDMVSQDDIRAEYNMSECEKYNIPYGVYIYSYALSIEEAHSEAQHMKRMIKYHKPTLGIWFDMEDADSYKRRHGKNIYQNKSLWTDLCTTFLADMNSFGYPREHCGTYACLDWFRNCLDYNTLDKAGKIWLAQWGSNKSLKCDMWQYSDSGRVNGINGLVDLDYLYTDIEEPKTEPQKASEEYYPPVVVNTNSIIQICNLLGIDSSYNFRCKLAEVNEVENYRGTAAQNIYLCTLAKNGKLVRVSL